MKYSEERSTGPEEFLTVLDVASLLNVRPSTVYQWVSSREIPHYRFGRIVRFKRKDLEAWVEGFRKEREDDTKKVIEILRAMGRETQVIDRIIEKSIDEVRGLNYTFCNGRPDRIKSLRREGQNGAI
ncbi:MAG: helix-turn-helix domain-containing protein [Thermodesulfobacteriota bacterium]